MRRFSPLRDKLAFWFAIIAIAIACVTAVIVSGRVAHESKQRTDQLQDVICGVYVPIGNAPLPVKTSALGKTIVAATRHGAVAIHCPGIK